MISCYIPSLKADEYSQAAKIFESSSKVKVYSIESEHSSQTLREAIQRAEPNQDVLYLLPRYGSRLSGDELVSKLQELSSFYDLVYLGWFGDRCESQLLNNKTHTQLIAPKGFGALYISATNRNKVDQALVAESNLELTLQHQIYIGQLKVGGLFPEPLYFRINLAHQAIDYLRTQQCVLPDIDAGRPQPRTKGLTLFWIVIAILLLLMTLWYLIVHYRLQSREI